VKAPADDSELLRRSSEGDRAAFEAFMERHVAAVHRLLLSLQTSADEAEDALQDCFISAWRSAATYHGPGSARGWLFTIARNALRRQHRHRAGEPPGMVSLETLGEQAGWGSAIDFGARFEARDMVERALMQLPEDEREVVALRDLSGLSGDETAAALGVSMAAMKSRLHRGRLRLMGVLRALEVDNA
jgi:RNA polymerase sigma-70 factor, ECF subfamily